MATLKIPSKLITDNFLLQDFIDDFNAVNGDLEAHASDIGSLQTNVSTLQTDVSSIEAMYPMNSLYKQAIINGNFDIWQRGLIFNSIASNSYTVDRWQTFWNGTTTINVSRQAFAIGQTEVPNSNFFARIQQSVATGQTVNSFFNQQIEGGVEAFAGKTVTLSFYAKADRNATFTPGLKQFFGTGSGGSPTVDIWGAGINLTTSWQRFITTITLPSIAGKVWSDNYDPRLFVLLQFPLNTVVTLDIAQVQLNVGNTALPFMPKSFAQELLDCMRYYEKSYSQGVYAGDTTLQGSIYTFVMANGQDVTNKTLSFKIPKRVVPSIIAYAPITGTYSSCRNHTKGTTITPVFEYPSTNGFNFYLQNTQSVNDMIVMQWIADAEL